MKKFRIKGAVAAAAALAIVSCLALAGCSSNGAGSNGAASGEKDSTVITVAATPTPHAEILNAVVKDELAAKGYTLEVEEFNDYVLPNRTTEEGEVDANYFQHLPYLNEFNEQNGTHLVEVVPVHYEPFGLYPGKTASLDQIPDGAQIAIPNDTTNEARALLLLQQAGLITLDPAAGITATPRDVVDNPHNIKFVEAEAATLPRVLEDVDFAAINSNFAIGAGLNVYEDALVYEDAEGEAAQTYANYLVVKEGNQDSDAIKALAEALNSDAVRQYLQDTYQDGSVLPAF